jgi:hypothetical protein
MGPVGCNLLFPPSEKRIMLAKLAILGSLVLIGSRAEPLAAVPTSYALCTLLPSAAADAENEYRVTCTPFGFCWPDDDNDTLFVFSR